MTRARIGVMFDRDWPPEGLPAFARRAEALGLDDLWVVEDLGWNGGIAAAAAALAATERLRVGIGIAPAPLRSPALLAMELATLARVHPGRLVAGIGHGVPEWMASVGAAPRSPLALLEETITAVRALLHGEHVEVAGREVRIDGLQLVHPPADPPPVVAGVVRARSLELSGRVADGTVITEGHGPQDLEHAGELIRTGGAKDDHSLIVFTFCSIGDDADRVAAALRPSIESHAAWLGRSPDEIFTISGPPRRAAEQIGELARAGAETIVLRVLGPEPLGQLEAVLPFAGTA